LPLPLWQMPDTGQFPHHLSLMTVARYEQAILH
jgi:hypothetical protein